MNWFDFLVLLIVLIPPILIFIGRNWLKEKIVGAVQHEFNARLENLRADLRSKEAEITALREGVLSGRANRQAMLDKRRMEAVEKLWGAVIDLAYFKNISANMAIVKFEEVAKETPRDPRIRQIFDMMAKIPVDTKKTDHYWIGKEQPFISPIAWGLFAAYQSIVLGAYTQAKLLSSGIEDAEKLLNVDRIKNLLKAALPHQEKYIEEYGTSGFHWLLDELESKLLAELRRTLEGKEADAADLERYTTLISLTSKTNNRYADLALST